MLRPWRRSPAARRGYRQIEAVTTVTKCTPPGPQRRSHFPFKFLVRARRRTPPTQSLPARPHKSRLSSTQSVQQCSPWIVESRHLSGPHRPARPGRSRAASRLGPPDSDRQWLNLACGLRSEGAAGSATWSRVDRGRIRRPRCAHGAPAICAPTDTARYDTYGNANECTCAFGSHRSRLAIAPPVRAPCPALAHTFQGLWRRRRTSFGRVCRARGLLPGPPANDGRRSNWRGCQAAARSRFEVRMNGAAEGRYQRRPPCPRPGSKTTPVTRDSTIAGGLCDDSDVI